MRHILRIIIIVAIIVTFPLWKNKVSDVYHRIQSYIVGVNEESPKEDGNTSIESKESIKGNNTISSNNMQEVDTPGALRVVDSLLSIGDTHLTVKGIITETNQERVAFSLPLLSENTKLNLSAQKKIEDMFDKQYFEHISPDGTGVSDLADDVKYEFIIIGENLALGGFKDDQAVVTAWMNSPGHRANILNDRYMEIGVSVGRGLFEGRQVWIAVQHFGLPRSACPNISTTLKSTIDSAQTKISSMQSELEKMKKEIDENDGEDPAVRNKLIQEYNELVAVYNNLIAQTKKNIETYNAQVRAFNACVEA